MLRDGHQRAFTPISRAVTDSRSEGDDMFTEEDRHKLNRVDDRLERYEPLTWTKQL